MQVGFNPPLIFKTFIRKSWICTLPPTFVDYYEVWLQFNVFPFTRSFLQCNLRSYVIHAVIITVKDFFYPFGHKWFRLHAALWLKLLWSYVRRVLSSSALPNMACFFWASRFPSVATLNPWRVVLPGLLGRTALPADRLSSIYPPHFTPLPTLTTSAWGKTNVTECFSTKRLLH